MLELALGLGTLAAGIGSSALSWWNQRRSENLQRDLANTAVQRRVADLRAAGINPILAANGQGAAVPSVQPVRFENPMEAAADVYVAAKRIGNESSLLEEQRAKLTQEVVNLKETAKLTAEQVKNTAANTAMTWKKMTEAEFWQQLFRVAGNTLSRYLGSRKPGQDADGAFEVLADELAKQFGVKRTLSRERIQELWQGEVETSGGVKAPPHKVKAGEKPHGAGSMSGGW